MADFSEFTEVANNPAAQAASEQILAEANAETPGAKPEIPLPPDDLVVLPSGTRAVVIELTGEHEERLAKARNSDDATRWYNTLLDCGTESLNGKEADREALDQLLVGDRESLMLAIRAATYGKDVEVPGYCPECREPFEGSLDVTAIPTTKWDGEDRFEVKLRKGGIARVRLPRGADQNAYMEDPDLTDSERNSLLLSRVVITLPSGGDDMPVAGFPSLVRELGVFDRRSILSEIDKRMPGPRYDELVIEHECGTSVPVPPVGMVSLFPGL